MAEHLPAFGELPVRRGAPPGSSWGLWDEHDVLGALNLLTPQRVVQAATLVRKGAVFALNLEMHLPEPPLFGRASFRHTVTGRPGGTSHDDVLDSWNTQSSSQWDGFRHIGHPEHGFYGGVADEDHGMHHWASRGLAGRAVLCDVARYREQAGNPLAPNEPDPIAPEDLQAALDSQGSTLEPGDVLLIRTGWLSWYRTQGAGECASLAEGFASTGLRPGQDTAAWLWDNHVAAVAADNPALEVWPIGSLAEPGSADAARREDTFLHFRLLPLLGIPIGELFELDPLAQDCADDGVYECFFTSAPLNLQAGVASPPNALAIK